MNERYARYLLTEEEEATFGIEEVAVVVDDYFNGIVINHPVNGVLAGDRLRSRKNIHFDPSKSPSRKNRELTYTLTDDHNALQSVRLAEAKRADENQRTETTLGSLAIIGERLPQLVESGEDEQQHYLSALRKIIKGEERALSRSKQEAVSELEYGLAVFEARGFRVPAVIRDAAMRATSHFRERGRELASQETANRQRQRSLQSEFNHNQMVKDILSELGRRYASIAEAPATYLDAARRILSKPGALTVNNAWFRREEVDSWSYLVRAQRGWEPLYGALMKPMSMLAKEKKEDARQSPGELLEAYTSSLLALEDIIDLSMIGKDYNELASHLREQLYHVEELLINGRVEEAITTAKQYRFLLRYRTLDPLDPPPQWYGSLPGIRTEPEPVELTPEEIKNPFHGLGLTEPE